jgi:CRISPR-associated protein (TIGR03986 family)
MKQIRLTIDLTLIAPILTQASTAGKIALDAPFAKLPDLRCFLPFSLIKGRLRQSWDELDLPDTDLWFGNRKGDWKGSRGRFRFSDFVELPSPGRATKTLREKTGERHRIRIDESRGAADEGQLQFIESPFPAGERVTFRGDVTWFDDDGGVKSRQSLLHAFRWTGSFGAGRTIGFGRVDRVETPEEETATVGEGASAATASPSGIYAMTLEIRDPFCLARKRIDENLFSSDEEIPGSVVRGILATTLNRLLKRDSADPIAPGDARGTEWNEIADHLNAIRFSHSFPADKDRGRRPVHPPLSLVRDSGSRVSDVAFCEGPVLINGAAPVFSIDWKGDEWPSVRKDAGWPLLNRTIRTRTAIDRDTKRAETARLFSYEMIDPSGIVWIGTADFSAVGEAVRSKVVAQFERIFAMEPAALGKTKAPMGIHLTPAAASTGEAGDSTQWAVTLQTPALLCDPARLNEASGRDALFAAYASAWSDISNEQLQLVRFFASQSLTGGYLAHRFSRQKSYAPFLLTDPRSVFVLSGTASGAKLLRDWERSGLPLPKWARTAHGETWETNPYLPADGFGEIAVDLECHTKQPPRDYVLVDQWPAIDLSNVPPAPEPPAHDDKPLETTDRKKEDTTVGTVKRAGFSSRWLIRGRIDTESEFHLGSGEKTRRKSAPLLADVDISAVAVDQSGAAYIPGSSLKGALRSWAEKRFDRTLVDAVFGGDSDDQNARAGKAEFHDAMFVDAVGAFDKVPYWDADRRTGVTASVAIDRWTRTAEDKKLFHREYVPAGVSFDVVVAGHDLSDTDVALLLFALRGFGEREEPVTLGAETGSGWGRFKWTEPPAIQRLDHEGLAAWRQASQHVGYSGLSPIEESLLKADVDKLLKSRKSAALSIPIELKFNGPFLVNEPSLTKTSKDDTLDLPNHAPRIDAEGNVTLPTSSFRGALRAQAERIARTIGIRACRATDPVDACRPIQNESEKHRLCVTCRLFGATGWASPLGFSSFRLQNQPAPFDQELVAIDRFTGGAAGGAKFNVTAKWKPEFTATITVDRDRLEEPEVGLLVLTLRDLAEGDIAFGFGASKGYGNCTCIANTSHLAGEEAIAKLLEAAAPASSEQHLPDASPAIDHIRDGRKPSNDEFFNPYHFVPLGAVRTDDMPRQELQQGRAPDEQARVAGGWQRVGHDRYVPGTFSGRIVCRLTTVTPLVVGAKRTPADGTGIVEPFLDPETGKPAIPATSLRGLISGIAEAASNSALRVLHDAQYSVRSSMSESMQAIGMVKGDRILPLALPVLSARGANASLFEVPQPYRAMFQAPKLKAFVDGYSDVVKNSVSYAKPSFLNTSKPKSYSAANHVFWYAELSPEATQSQTRIACHEGYTKNRGNTTFLLGRRVLRGPIDRDALEKLDPAEQAKFTEGILRVLGIDSRENDIPNTKHHEIFIPCDSLHLASGVTYNAEAAIKEFERLADLRMAMQKRELERLQSTDPDNVSARTLPFSLKGADRNANPSVDGQKLRLRDGDIVFFEPNGDGTTVKRLAIASIWRRGAENTHAYFPKELLPFNRERQQITIAERLFGFVQQDRETEPRDERSLALAGRVRLSNGVFAGRAIKSSTGIVVEDDPQPYLINNEEADGLTTLKILSSPKPPSPALYFQPRGGVGHVAKSSIDAEKHRPQGRKFYLHNAAARDWSAAMRMTAAPWPTLDREKNADQKSRVKPIGAERAFFFHVDFENLDEEELGLLCYAIRPTDEFRHKLGMGKPLGLGSVCIDPLGIFLIDRQGRYRDSSARYALMGDDASTTALLPGWYSEERKAAGSLTPQPWLGRLRDRWRQSMDANIRNALELIGESWPSPVHTPQVAAKRDLEDETYAWFATNEAQTKHLTGARQFLTPLNERTISLPPLARSNRRTDAQTAAEAVPLVTPRRPAPSARPPAAGTPERVSDRVPPLKEVTPKPSGGKRIVIRFVTTSPEAESATEPVVIEDAEFSKKRTGNAPPRLTIRHMSLGKEIDYRILPNDPANDQLAKLPPKGTARITVRGSKEGTWQLIQLETTV